MGVNIIGRMKYDNLLAGDFPQNTEAVVLTAGSEYPVGAVLGMVTATGKCVLVDSAKSDGSEEPFGVLLSAVDATEGDAEGVVSVTGQFNQNALTFGGSDTWETHKRAAQRNCLFFREPAP